MSTKERPLLKAKSLFYMKKADLFFNVLRLPVDFAMLLIAGLVTYIFRTQILDAFRPVLFEFNLPLAKYFYLVLFTSMLFLISYAISGLYSMKTKIGRAEEFIKIIVASSAAVMILIVYIFLRQELFNSRFLVLGGWFFGIIFVAMGRIFVRNLQNFLVSNRDFGIHKVVIIGEDSMAEKIIKEIQNNPQSGYRIAGHLINPKITEIISIKKDSEIDEIFLADPNYPSDKAVQLIEFCNENHLVFKFVPNIYQTLAANVDIDNFNGLPLIELRRTALDGWGRVIKRVVDIIAAAIGLVVISPFIAVVALAIKWETAGPVFVGLKRISRNKEFSLIKLRSMVKNAEELKPYLTVFNERQDGPLFKIKNDPRITKVGGFIRKYRIDELPQFWNVLRGDISLVGPRPHQPDEISKYEKHHKRVLAIKAGATGLAQVSGSSDLPFEQEVTLDTFYVENWSLSLDLKIILKTIFKVFTDRSAV